jgi:hypothetical protein
MNRRVRLVLAAALLLALPAIAQDAEAPRWETRAQLEEHAFALDRRVVVLQKEVRAARYGGDTAELQRAEAELKDVKSQRVDALRALGQLP